MRRNDVIVTPTTKHPRVLEVERAIRLAGYDGDFSAMEALMSPDAILYAHCGGLMGGVHRGREGCLGNMRRLDALVGGTMHLDTIHTTGNDAFVVMFNRVTALRDREMPDGTRDRVELDEMMCAIWRFVDGQMVETTNYFHNAPAWDAFWRFDDYDACRSTPGSGGEATDELRDAIGRIARSGSIAPARSLLAPDVVAHIGGTSTISGTYTGLDEVLSVLDRVKVLCDGRFGVEAEQVLASEQYVAIFNRVRATRGGESIEDVVLTLWRIDAGRVVEVRVHVEDVDAWDRFWRGD